MNNFPSSKKYSPVHCQVKCLIMMFVDENLCSLDTAHTFVHLTAAYQFCVTWHCRSSMPALKGGCEYTPLNSTKLTHHHWIMTTKRKCTFGTPLNLLIFSEPTSKKRKTLAAGNIMNLRMVQLNQEINCYCHRLLNPDYHAE